MADLVVNAVQVAPCYSDRAEIHNHIAGVALEAGQAVTLDATGGVISADADDAGANTCIGIALQSVGAGQPVAVLYRGHVVGFTLDGMDVNAPVYLSDNAGKVADAPSATKDVQLGRVSALSDRTPVLYIDAPAG